MPVAIIAGTAIYNIPGKTLEAETVETSYGPALIYRVAGEDLIFLARHGIKHDTPPHRINYRANIHGFRQLGVRYLLSVSAVGSLRQDIHPGDIVLPDQFIDRTRGRPASFFGEGAVAHVQFGDPVCPNMLELLDRVLNELGVSHHRGGTYVAMEGPAFSTRAESELYRSWGADVIGMTSIPEAKLAREAEICYVTMALCTDYDCWHEEEEEVSVEAVLKVIKTNIITAKRVIAALTGQFPPRGSCHCQRALENTLLTSPESIPEQTRERLQLLIGRFLDGERRGG